MADPWLLQQVLWKKGYEVASVGELMKAMGTNSPKPYRETLNSKQSFKEVIYERMQLVF